MAGIEGPIRFATFNASLNRDAEGQLITDLSTPNNPQAKAIAEIIQRTNPDVLLVNEFDFDPDGQAAALFQENYLSNSQNEVNPVEYPYRYIAPSNTGIPSELDLDNDGSVGGPNDAFGFGFFPGQYAMVLYSKYPIDTDNVRTFQDFLWQDMPRALLPDDPATGEPKDWYSPAELEAFRLSSKNHWDIPIEVNGGVIHVLASHPTPPAFDGPEQRNVKRNNDEIRFWADYITPGKDGYIYDDRGSFGGLSPGSSFVIMGDQNADPSDGGGIPGAIQQLLDNSQFNTSVTPESEGGPEQSDLQGEANVTHESDPAFDTADFSDSPSPGNLRVDYVLPSTDLRITDSAVFWPESSDPLFPLVGTFDPSLPPTGFPSSDHRLVWADVQPTLTVRPTVETPPVFDAEDPPSGPPLASADDPAIYVHPTDPSLSLVITALKNGGLQVHDLKGQLLQMLAPDSPDDLRYNNVDPLYGFNLGGQPVDLVVASDRLNDTLAIFRIDPTTRQLTNITAPGILESIFGVDDGEQTAYGLANYVSPISGKAYSFVTQSDGNKFAQLELVDNGAGQVDAKLVRTLTVPIPDDDELDAHTEGVVADQELGHLYVGQEDVGIWKFSAEPDGGATGTLIDEVYPNGSNLKADVEGLTIYYAEDGKGYLLASSQGDSTFAVYSREGDNDYLGSFIVGESGGIDRTDGSDGLDVTNLPLGPEFPSGLLVVHDQLNEPAFLVEDEEEGELENVSGNFKFVPWENVANAFPDPLAIATTSFDPRSLTAIHNIQGTAHRSPFEGQTVFNIPGIVTALRDNGFYLQDPNPDRNPATSEGIFVFTASEPTISIGDSVLVDGTVSEFRPGGAETGNLTTTQLVDPTVTVVSSDNPLPDPTILGSGGRTPPTQIIDNDASNGNVENPATPFDPTEDGIDFYESLEGMRVQVNDAVAVSPTDDFGQIFVLPDNGENATGRTPRGGIIISPDDFNPERIQIDDEDVGILSPEESPQANVGDRLGTVTGVLDYSFGNFEILNTTPISVTPGGLTPETTTLTSGSDQLTIASYNVLNLDPVDDPDDPNDGPVQINAIASQITKNLKSPDIIALQEIQDNNGASPPDSANDSVVDASDTYNALIDAIAEAGGPRYQFRDIPPVDDKDGGEPGGNIRVGYLFNSARVDFVDRPGGSSISDTTVVDGGLSASPGRIDPLNPAFADSRKPLASEFSFNGDRVVVINNHFASKGGSDPLLGRFQPPTNGGESQRQAQAQVVNDFVDDLLATDPNANVVALGDLNEFQFLPPLDILRGNVNGEQPVLANLTETLPESERYSYIFEGNSQTLDHILVSNNLADRTEYDVVHVNAEFADRASDHEPVLARLTFPESTSKAIALSPIGTYETGVFNQGAAEIVAHDPETQRLFVVNANNAQIDVLDASDPANLTKAFEIDVTPYGAVANGVAVNNGIVAVAVENEETQMPGAAVFFDTDGNFLSAVEVGALPDMLTFTPDGQKVLVANEGEPSNDYLTDPEGSVSIIDLSGGVADLTQDDVTTADFRAFNNQEEVLTQAGVRIFGPNATVAQDLEPEYITVSQDSTTAWIALQENNALGVLNLTSGQITDILPLGFKDHNASGNSLDVSNADDAINIANWPISGMYQPDGITSYEVNGETFIITANEGDSRDYSVVIDEENEIEEVSFSEEAQVADLDLDPTAFPNAAELQADEALGGLTVTTANGDTDGDGDFEELYAFGGRSFAIWDEQGSLVYDSGDDFEQITAELIPEDFNSDNTENDSFDSRSDAKGPEPEGVVVGEIDGHTYAFIGLERVGGVMTYDVTDPTNPEFINYINNRDFSVEFDPEEAESGESEAWRAAGDLGPEGLAFISAEESPNGNPLLAVGNEVSGTTTLFEIANSLNGSNGQNTFELSRDSGSTIITDFGGVGTGINPSSETIAEVDTLKFQGVGLTAENMLLTQADSDLIIEFDGVQNLKVTLKNFDLENLDNLRKSTGASVNIGNILFDGQTAIQDSFDVFNSDWQRGQVFNRNSVTFLNDLNNDIKGSKGSSDVINGQGGNDILTGLGSNGILRGGSGNDILDTYLGTGNNRLYGGDGDDFLIAGVNDQLFGGNGNDVLLAGEGGSTLTGGDGIDQFQIAYGSLPKEANTITDFKVETDVIGIAGLSGVSEIGDLNITQNGADTLINGLDTDLAILTGIQANTLINSNSFIFV